jgi:hypothetical protein
MFIKPSTEQSADGNLGTQRLAKKNKHKNKNPASAARIIKNCETRLLMFKSTSSHY